VELVLLVADVLDAVAGDLGDLAHVFGLSLSWSVRPTSPPITTRLVVAKVSQATRASGSSARKASRTASEIRSQTLSGCPSETDSEVKM
jgi:hypothetical protein